MTAATADLIVRNLVYCDYETVWQAMRAFTDHRNETTSDEIWLIEHPPVYTLGQAGKEEHVLNPGNIPLLHVDRGGQVTYHGPGQLVVYFMLDLRRKGIGARDLVSAIEQGVVAALAEWNIAAHARSDAPGIYTEQGAKMGSIGLRIRRGRSYHGLAFNVAMDLSPFLGINPCGYRNLAITQLSECGGPDTLSETAPVILKHLMEKLGYTNAQFLPPAVASKARE